MKTSQTRAGVNGTPRSTPLKPTPLFIQWVGERPTPQRPYGILTLALGKEITDYFIMPLYDIDFGEAAWELSKLVKGQAMTVYHVLLDGKNSSCSCPGHESHRHCKHLDAIQFLTRTGQLPKPQPKPERTDEPAS